MSNTSVARAISPGESIALLFPCFKTPPSSSLIADICNHLKQYRINTIVVPINVVTNNVGDFRKLETDEDLMQRLVSVVDKILNEIEPERRRHLLLFGIAGGIRLMVAFSLAKKLGLVPDAESYDIPGLMSFNMYTNLRFSKSTLERVTQLQHINQMDVKTNIVQLTETLIYDVYANIDSVTADSAVTRKELFDKAGLNYKQACITCCDISKDTYYEKQDGEYYVYTEISGHNLRNAYLKQKDDTYKCTHRLHGGYDAPIENLIDQFLIEAGVYRVQ